MEILLLYYFHEFNRDLKYELSLTLFSVTIKIFFSTLWLKYFLRFLLDSTIIIDNTSIITQRMRYNKTISHRCIKTPYCFSDDTCWHLIVGFLLTSTVYFPVCGPNVLKVTNFKWNLNWSNERTLNFSSNLAELEVKLTWR